MMRPLTLAFLAILCCCTPRSINSDAVPSVDVATTEYKERSFDELAQCRAQLASTEQQLSSVEELLAIHQDADVINSVLSSSGVVTRSCAIMRFDDGTTKLMGCSQGNVLTQLVAGMTPHVLYVDEPHPQAWPGVSGLSLPQTGWRLNVSFGRNFFRGQLGINPLADMSYQQAEHYGFVPHLPTLEELDDPNYDFDEWDGSHDSDNNGQPYTGTDEMFELWRDDPITGQRVDNTSFDDWVDDEPDVRTQQDNRSWRSDTGAGN